MTDIKNWSKLEEKTAKLMLDQCETALRETTDTAKSISEKAEKITTILLPVTTAVITYLFTQNWSNLTMFLPLTAICCLPFLLTSIGFAYLNFSQYEIAIPGDFPRNIVRTEFVDKEYTPDQQYVNLTLSICENIQRKIDINEQANTRRLRFNLISIRVLGCLMLCPAVAFLLLLCLPGHHS